MAGEGIEPKVLIVRALGVANKLIVLSLLLELKSKIDHLIAIKNTPHFIKI